MFERDANLVRLTRERSGSGTLAPLALLDSIRHDDHPVAYFKGRLQRWAAFRTDVEALAARFARRGRGRWLVASDNAYSIAVGLFAGMQAQCGIVLPANHQPAHLALLGRDVVGVAADLGEIAVPSDAIPLVGGERFQAHAPLRPVDSADTEIVLYSSGSTGEPVSIQRNLLSLESEVSTLESMFGRRVSGGVVATVPAYHIYGLLFRVLWPLATGRLFADTTIHLPHQLIAAVGNVSPQIFVSSPAFLKRALPALEGGRLGGSLSAVFSSGGRLPDDIFAVCAERLGAPLYDVYGSTETGGIAYRSGLDSGLSQRWRVLPGVDTSIDPETGCLCVRSPHAAGPGWFRTGDTATIEPGGTLILGGRADRIVKIEEHRVSLDEVEQRLATCSEIAVVRAIAVPGAASDRFAVAAAVVPSEVGWNVLADEGKNALKQRLRDQLSLHLDPMAMPRRWRFVRKLPQTAHGKLVGSEVAALFQSDLGRAIAPEIVDRMVADGLTMIRMRLQPTLFWFRGHFDDFPVLPGVVQISWAIRFALDAFGLDAPVTRIEALKFFRVMQVGASASLTLSFDPSRRLVLFNYADESKLYSSGRLILAEVP